MESVQAWNRSIAPVWDSVHSWVRAIVAALVGLWHGLPQITQLLVLLMALDIALGVAIAIRDKRVDVAAARVGAGKKFASLVMVGVASVLNPHVQPLVGVNLVQAASAYYIVPELGSVTRNTALLGAPTFPQLELILGYFKAMAGEAKETETHVDSGITKENAGEDA